MLVVYNSDSPDGCRAAKYYALRRGVPEKNLLGLPLRGAEKGSSWRHFHSRILTPIREKLRSKCDDGTVLAERILYIVTTPGMPRAMTTGHARFEHPVGGRSAAGWRSCDQWLISLEENFTAGAGEAAKPAAAKPPYWLGFVRVGKGVLLRTRHGKVYLGRLKVAGKHLAEITYTKPGRLGDLAFKGKPLGDYMIALPKPPAPKGDDKGGEAGGAEAPAKPERTRLGDYVIPGSDPPLKLGDVQLHAQTLGAAGPHVRLRPLMMAFLKKKPTTFRRMRAERRELSGVYLVTRLGCTLESARRAVDGAVYAERYLRGDSRGPKLSFWLDQKFGFAGDQVASQINCCSLVHPDPTTFAEGGKGPLAPWPLVIDNMSAEIGMLKKDGSQHVPTARAKIKEARGGYVVLEKMTFSRKRVPVAMYFAEGAEVVSGGAKAKILAVDVEGNRLKLSTTEGMAAGAEVVSVWPGKYPATDCFFFFGFYGLGKYEDVFAFPPGALGIHVDSACRKWATRAMERGISATYGVYSAGIPYGHVALASLARGNDLAESFTSAIMLGQRWAGIIYGDPLYAPFRGEKRRDRTRPVVVDVTAVPENGGVRVSARLGGRSPDQLADVALYRVEFGEGRRLNRASDFYEWPRPEDPGKVEGRRYSGYARQLSRLITGLEPGRRYRFRVVARDPAANESRSRTVSAVAGATSGL